MAGPVGVWFTPGWYRLLVASAYLVGAMASDAMFGEPVRNRRLSASSPNQVGDLSFCSASFPIVVD